MGSTNSANVATQIVRFPFVSRFIVTTSASTALMAPQVLNPTNTSLMPGRIASMAAIFDSYRFTKLEVDVMPNSSATEVLGTLGYTQDALTTSGPTTDLQVLQLACSVYTTPNQTTSVKLRIPPKYLRSGPLKWYKCSNATDSFEADQGLFYGYTSANCTGTFSYVLKGVCEFKDPIISGESLERALRLLRETADPAPDPGPAWNVVIVQNPDRSGSIPGGALQELPEEKQQGSRARSLPPGRR